MPSLLDLFGSGADAYGGLISPEQKAALQNNALMNAGLAMLAGSTGQAGGPRPGFGQILAQGAGAGQRAYQQGTENVVAGTMTALKLAEARRKLAVQNLIQNTLNGPSEAPAASGGVSGVAGPLTGGGGAAPAPMSASASKAARYRQVANAIAAYDPDTAKNYLEIADRLDPQPDYGQPVEVVGADGKPLLARFSKTGGMMPVEGYGPKKNLPSEIEAVEYLTGKPVAGTGQAGMDTVGNYNRSKAVSVNVEGKQDFKNERALWGEFTGLPVYKNFSELQGAFDQVRTALASPSPANDLTAATKFMKLLDPGSVVRESELGLAMSATGMLDRVMAYKDRLTKGEILTPAQRKDFLQASTALYNAAANRFRPYVDQYRKLATEYGLDASRVVPPNISADDASPVAPAAPAANDPLGIRR